MKKGEVVIVRGADEAISNGFRGSINATATVMASPSKDSKTVGLLLNSGEAIRVKRGAIISESDMIRDMNNEKEKKYLALVKCIKSSEPRISSVEAVRFKTRRDKQTKKVVTTGIILKACVSKGRAIYVEIEEELDEIYRTYISIYDNMDEKGKLRDKETVTLIRTYIDNVDGAKEIIRYTVPMILASSVMSLGREKIRNSHKK